MLNTKKEIEMVYMGSKNRIAKYILPIMLKERGDRTWVEPFVGGANMIDKVDGDRIGADFNEYLIEALKLIRDSPESLPERVSKEEYIKLKNDKIVNGLTGWVGFVCSFRAKWFAGYAYDKRIEDRGGESAKAIASAARNNALKQSPKLKGVTFIQSSYKYLEIPPDSLIYCDPPYENTTKYKDAFNHLDFWQWCREKHKEGHSVFISEYNAPDDFRCVWEGELNSNMYKNTGVKAIEKLFTFDELY